MPHQISKLIVVTCLQLYCCCAFAQPQKKYQFTRFGKVNGLAADQCFSVVQDKQGFIWIATNQGLQRFDGTRFITFRHDDTDSTSIPADDVDGLLVDKKGRLWVTFFNNKISILNTVNFKFLHIKLVIPAEFKKNIMLRPQEDDDGTIHTSIQGYGVITYNEKKNEFSAAHNIIRLLDGSNVAEINKTKIKGSYLVTTQNGLDLYNKNTQQWAPRNSNGLLRNMNKVLSENKSMGPAHIFTDKKGRIWSDIWLNGKKEAGPQVFSYNPADDSWNEYKKSIDIAAMAYHSINGFLEQKNGDIWLHGTSLFAKFNEEKKIFEDIRNESLKLNGIDLETVYQLYEDRDANIWISSSNGLFMFNPGKQIFSNLPNIRKGKDELKNSVDAVLQSQSGIIYTSTWGAGIFAYDSNFNVVPNPLIPIAKDNNGFAGWDMHERKNGEIWIAVQGGSIRIYDPKKNKTTELKLSVFENKTVRQVIEDSIGNMWMGTQYGLIIKCTNSNWHDTVNAFKVMHRFKGRITKMVTDKKGFVWVCTDRFGLYKLNASDGSIADHYDEESPAGKRLQTAGANDVFQYNDSILLIASKGLNVLNTNTNKISFINTNYGKESNSLHSILRDKQGYLWLAFYDGICRMELGKNIFLYFGSEDGISNKHFQLNASTVLDDGRILLGTTTDFLVFDPLKINLSKISAPVIISGFLLADKNLQVDSLLRLKKIILPYYNNTFTINLTTFSYLHDHAILYMLEGDNDKWQLAANNQVTFNRLPPGTYTFKVKSISASGAESDTITQVIITIVPPFWSTWWFYGLLILSGLVIFYLVDRERMLRIKATQKLRTDIALSLHHDVNTSLNNINLLSEMARMKVDKDITKSKALIEQISEKSNDMIIAMDDMLWVIDPANDNMEKTVLRMNEFIDALSNRHEAEIDIHIDEKVKDLKLDMKLRHGFFFIFKTALRCMIQYSGMKQALINVDLQKNGLYLKMYGTTAISDTDSHNLKCMEEMKIHAANIHAELDIQNNKTESSIVLIMPVK